jgi:hypothetical protein
MTSSPGTENTQLLSDLLYRSDSEDYPALKTQSRSGDEGKTETTGMNAMRDIPSRDVPVFRTFLSSPGLRLTAVIVGLGLILGSNTVRAGDDEEDNRTFERTLIDNLMSGIGAKRNEESGIEYRERSPLVVPSKIDLPPPETGKRKPAANWPQDPEIVARKAAIEADKRTTSIEEDSRPLMPSELAAKTPKRVNKQQVDNTKPGDDPRLMPSELGYTGGLFSNIFGGSSSKPEVKTFKSEPERDSLTQPPSGYQTPSSNYAYGVGAPGSDPGYEEVYDNATGKLTRQPKNY